MTTTAKRTPGPWVAEINRQDGARICVAEDRNATVAYVHPDTITATGREMLSELGVANARLIAAAPTMLEALRDCIMTLARFHPETMAYKLACEALSLAEGGES